MDNRLEDIDKRLIVVEATMATKDGLADVRSELHAMEARMAWRFVALYGAIVSSMAGLLALFKFLH